MDAGCYDPHPLPPRCRANGRYLTLPDSKKLAWDTGAFGTPWELQ